MLDRFLAIRAFKTRMCLELLGTVDGGAQAASPLSGPVRAQTAISLAHAEGRTPDAAGIAIRQAYRILETWINWRRRGGAARGLTGKRPRKDALLARSPSRATQFFSYVRCLRRLRMPCQNHSPSKRNNE